MWLINSFADRKLEWRLGAGFGLVLAFVMAMVVIGFMRFASVSEINQKIIEQDWIKADAANVIMATTRANAHETMELLIAPDKTRFAEIIGHIEENKKTITNALATLDRLTDAPDGKALLSRIKSERAAYIGSVGLVSQLIADGKREEATRLMLERTLPALNVLQGAIKDMVDLQKKKVQADSMDARKNIDQSLLLMLGLAVIAILMGAGYAYWMYRSLMCPYTCCTH